MDMSGYINANIFEYLNAKYMVYLNIYEGFPLLVHSLGACHHTCDSNKKGSELHQQLPAFGSSRKKSVKLVGLQGFLAALSTS